MVIIEIRSLKREVGIGNDTNQRHNSKRKIFTQHLNRKTNKNKRTKKIKRSLEHCDSEKPMVDMGNECNESRCIQHRHRKLHRITVHSLQLGTWTLTFHILSPRILRCITLRQPMGALRVPKDLSADLTCSRPPKGALRVQIGNVGAQFP